MLFLFFYDLFFILGLFLYIPIYIVRRKFSLKAFLEKLSLFMPLEEQLGKSIWIQAVSVGEVLAIKELIYKIKDETSCDIIISTTTLTGHSVAKKKYSNDFNVVFFPFDITFVLKRFINTVNPKLFIAFETELWPNLFYQLESKQIPIIVLNSRISDLAYSRYKKIKFFIKGVIKKVSFIGVQNDIYKRRFLSLGADISKITITGNIKFSASSIDGAGIEVFKEKYESILKSNGAKLIIAASTHHPEEKIMFDAYKKLKDEFNLSLLIAPRHPEKSKEVEKIANLFGLDPIMISGLDRISSQGVYILDTVGDLSKFYSLCDVCFVGGSLVNYGGHNILEPISLLKPTIFGPFMSNFTEIEEIALKYKAAIKIKSKHELGSALKRVLLDDELKTKLAVNCVNVFKQERKFLEKNIEIISNFI